MKQFLSTITSALSEILESCAELAGIAAAKYHEYYQNANQKAREEAKKQKLTKEYNDNWNTYQLYADLLAKAINNTTNVTNLQKISDYSQLTVPHWLGRNENVPLYYIYRGRTLDYSGANIRKIIRVLQAEMNCICSVSNMPFVKIDITSERDQVVIIRIAPASAFTTNSQNNR